MSINSKDNKKKTSQQQHTTIAHTINIYTAGQKFPDTWILFNFLIKTPIIISKKFIYHIYFIKDTYSYYLRKKKIKKIKEKKYLQHYYY